MARHIALTSTGTLSGKTTLATHLRDEYGFIIASHSLSVVRSFVEAWNEANDAPAISVDWVYKHKEAVRRDLQKHGYDIGFNDPDKAEYWIKRTLSESGCSITQARCPGSRPVICPDKDVVFDPIRGELQARVIKGLGFEIVQLDISNVERCRRAVMMGKDCVEVLRHMHHDPSLEMGVAHPDIMLDASLPVDQLGRILMHRPEDARGYTIFSNYL